MPFWGRLYWNLLYPIHRIIFRGMARGIARTAERMSAAASLAGPRLLGPEIPASGGLSVTADTGTTRP
jgi:hypothetical protein